MTEETFSAILYKPCIGEMDDIMADSIKTISDREHFSHLFNNYFAKGEVYLRTKNGNLSLQFLGYNDDHVSFRIPSVKNIPDAIIAFTRYRGATIYVSLKLYERNEDTFTFSPLKFQIISETRKEDRKLMGDEGAEKTVLYIYDLMSDMVIKNAISLQAKKVEQIVETAQFELRKRFAHSKVEFISTQNNDMRMKHLLETKTPIFVSDLNSNPEPEHEDDFNFYVNNIYKKDFKLQRGDGYISEATVPILFRELIPYGYVQVNDSRVISDGLFEVVKRIAIVIDQLFLKNKVFAPIPNKFLVSDISRSGLGIVFKDRRMTSYFRKDSSIVFETMLPTQKRAVMGAIVRNINFLDGSIIKVGLEVNQIDKVSRANVEEYLNMVGV